MFRNTALVRQLLRSSGLSEEADSPKHRNTPAHQFKLITPEPIGIIPCAVPLYITVKGSFLLSSNFTGLEIVNRKEIKYLD